MTTKEKFTDICYNISNDNGKYDVWWEYLKIYENDNDYQVLKNKITNFINKLNEDDSKWLNKDVENEIFEMM